MRQLHLIAALVFAPPAVAVPPDGDIHRIIEQRVQAIAGPEGGMGIVVGVIDEKGRRVIAYGDTGGADRRPLNGDTVFEIASVTKVFTALLLADMVRTGDLALTDPAAKYLPHSNGLSMTLVDLATHTAGLPKLRLRAEKEREFFTTELPLQAVFEVDSSGRVTSMLVHPPRGQQPIPARRL